MSDLTASASAVTPPPGCPAHQPGAIRLSGLQYQQTPSELYRAMRREHGAVAPVLLDGDIPAWLVLGYSEVSYVTRHDELFARDSRRWNQWDSIPADWPLLPFVGYQPSVLFTEGAEHQAALRRDQRRPGSRRPVRARLQLPPAIATSSSTGSRAAAGPS